VTVASIGPDGRLTLSGRSVPARLGRSGIVTNKREGDGGTPTGLLPLRRVLFRPDRLVAPTALVPVSALSPTDGWCDEPLHPLYNQAVTLPFDASHEALWREDRAYDVIGVLGWNDDPVVPHLGSAIFLHLETGGPTAGCIALSLEDLLEVLGELTWVRVHLA